MRRGRFDGSGTGTGTGTRVAARVLGSSSSFQLPFERGDFSLQRRDPLCVAAFFNLVAVRRGKRERVSVTHGGLTRTPLERQGLWGGTGGEGGKAQRGRNAHVGPFCPFAAFPPLVTPLTSRPQPIAPDPPFPVRSEKGGQEHWSVRS